MSELHELRRERDRLRAAFEVNGGRGVELADEIDEIEGKLEVLESPPKLREAIRLITQLAERYIEDAGEGVDFILDGDNRYSGLYIEACLDRVRRYIGAE